MPIVSGGWRLVLFRLPLVLGNVNCRCTQERNESRLGITHAGFAMTSLPHKRIEEGLWKREGHRTTLLVESGRSRSGELVGIISPPEAATLYAGGEVPCGAALKMQINKTDQNDAENRLMAYPALLPHFQPRDIAREPVVDIAAPVFRTRCCGDRGRISRGTLSQNITLLSTTRRAARS
jgi:hypothetical protein